MHVATGVADMTMGAPLGEPLEAEEARACIIHREGARKEAASATMRADQGPLVDDDFLRLFSHFKNPCGQPDSLPLSSGVCFP